MRDQAGGVARDLHGRAVIGYHQRPIITDLPDLIRQPVPAELGVEVGDHQQAWPRGARQREGGLR